MVENHRLTAADADIHTFDQMAALAERDIGLGAERFLHLQAAGVGEATWGVEGRLGVHAKTQEIGQKRRLADRLILAAHHAERPNRFAVLHQETRDDGVHRPLTGGDAIGVTGGQVESLAAVVQKHARTWRHDRRAEAGEDRIDEGNGVAVGVDHRQVDGVGMGRKIGWVEDPGARRVDHRPQLVAMGCRQQPLDRHIDLGRVADIGVALVITELGRLGQYVDLIDLTERRPIIAVENVHYHQGAKALAVGRAFEHVMTRETALDRVDVFGAGAGEIVEGVQTAKAAQPGDDIFGDGAGVKAVAALTGDGRQTVRQARLAEFAAQRRCRAVDQHDLAGDRVGAQDALVQNPVVIDPRINWKAVAGIGDGRR